MMLHEVLLKVESPNFRLEFGGDDVVGHGQQSDLHAPALAKLLGDLALGGSFAQSLAAVQMGGEVAVPQPEPGRSAQFGQFVHYPPGLAAQTPAHFVVVESGQGVTNRVEVRTDGQPVKYQIVTYVHDGRYLGGIEHGAQCTEESRGAHPAAENRYHAKDLRGLR